jgi:hypothetical protein
MTRPRPTWVDSILQTGAPVYPSYDAPISKWHPAVFEAAFVALHPFWRGDVAVSWAEVASLLGISVGRLNRGLLTRDGALRVEYRDSDAAARVSRHCETSALEGPIDGCIPPEWTTIVVDFFRTAGADVLWVIDGFGQVLQPCSASTAELDLSLGSVHRRGAIFSSVPGVLVSVDWDSFFTLFFASNSLLAPLPNVLEGFLSGIDTEHFWQTTPASNLLPDAG